MTKTILLHPYALHTRNSKPVVSQPLTRLHIRALRACGSLQVKASAIHLIAIRLSLYFQMLLYLAPFMAVLVWRCLLVHAPAYLQEFCFHTLAARARCSIRSEERVVLLVHFVSTSTIKNHALSVNDPSVWNGRPLAFLLIL